MSFHPIRFKIPTKHPSIDILSKMLIVLEQQNSAEIEMISYI